MRTTVTIGLALAVIACAQKQPDGTYRITNPVTTDTSKARNNAAKAGDEVNQKIDELSKTEPVQKIKEGSKEVGQGVKQGLGHAAVVAGEKLQEVGKKAEDSAKKRDTKAKSH